MMMKIREQFLPMALVLPSILLPITAFGQEFEKAKSLSHDLGVAPIPSNISSSGKVDKSIPKLLGDLKREIRQWITTKFTYLPRNIDSAQLQKFMRVELDKAGLLANSDDHLQHPFGKILGISISLPKQDLLQVILSYDGYCPPDDSVLLFERRIDQKWHLLLNLDNTDFDHPYGVRAFFYAGISPRDDGGHYYALVVRRRSFCPGSGGGDHITYHVLRPGANPESQQLLLTAGQTYRDNGDFRILLEGNSFTLDFAGWSFGPSSSRSIILKYAINESSVRRIQPIAVNPAAFVEEWMVSPWSLARDWSDLAQSSALAGWHEKINMESGGKSDLLGSEAFRQTCSSDQKLLQTTFPAWFPTTGPKSGDVFFLIRETSPHVYRLMNISRQSAPECSDPEPDDVQDEHLLPPSLNRDR